MGVVDGCRLARKGTEGGRTLSSPNPSSVVLSKLTSSGSANTHLPHQPRLAQSCRAHPPSPPFSAGRSLVVGPRRCRPCVVHCLASPPPRSSGRSRPHLAAGTQPPLLPFLRPPHLQRNLQRTAHLGSKPRGTQQTGARPRRRSRLTRSPNCQPQPSLFPDVRHRTPLRDGSTDLPVLLCRCSSLSSLTFTCTAILDPPEPPASSPEATVAPSEPAEDVVCSHRSTHTFTKQAYTKGIVLVECPGCKNRFVPFARADRPARSACLFAQHRR